MIDEECSRLKEELRILTVECERLNSLKCFYDAELAACPEEEEAVDYFVVDIERVGKRYSNVRNQFFKTLDELKMSLKQTESEKTDLKYLSDSILQFCNEDESNLTKLLTDFASSATAETVTEETAVQEQNQTDIDRLKATFEALGRKELELKLEKCLFDAQLDLLRDFDRGLLQDIPSPDCLQKSVAKLVTQIEELDKDNKKLFEELQINIPALFSKRKLLNVYTIDYENGERFCQKLIERQRMCLSEMEIQNSRLAEFLALLNGLSKEQTDNAKVVSILERVLKEKIKTMKRLKNIFDSTATDDCSHVAKAVSQSVDNCRQSPNKEIDTVYDASEKFFRKLLSDHKSILHDHGSNYLEKTLKMEEETKDLSEQVDHLEECLAVHVQKCSNKK